MTLNNMLKKIPQKQTSYTLEMAEKGQVPKISFGPKEKLGKMYYHDDSDVNATIATNGGIADAKTNGTIMNGRISSSSSLSSLSASSSSTTAVGLRSVQETVWSALRLVRNILDYSSPIMVSLSIFLACVF